MWIAIVAQSKESTSFSTQKKEATTLPVVSKKKYARVRKVHSSDISNYGEHKDKKTILS